MKPKFKAKIEKGKVIPERPDLLKQYYNIFEGKDVAISITKWSSIRTDQQNRYLHGVIFKMIADETGDTIEKAKINVKLEVGFFDIVQHSGEEFKILKETSKLDKIEFNAFVKCCRDFAKRFLNLYIPLPDECDYDDLYSYSY